MDPNEALKRIRATVARLQETDDAGDNDYDPQDVSELYQHVQALDEWITRGGFLPDAWQVKS